MPTWLRTLTARLSAFGRSGALDEDFDRELHTHLEMLTSDNFRRGMAPDQAERAARIRIGSMASLKAQHRDTRGLPLLDNLRQDVAFAVRLFARDPWFAATAIVTLALGLGINAMGFAVVHAAFLRGLPFDRSEQLLMLSWQTQSGRRDEVSIQDLRDWRRQSHAFAGLCGFVPLAMNVSDAGPPSEQVRGAWITANTFGLMHVQPILGRDLSPGDERRGAAGAMLISSQL